MMLEKIHNEIQSLTCLNNKDKLDHVQRKGVGHKDVLTLVTNRHQSQMTSSLQSLGRQGCTSQLWEPCSTFRTMRTIGTTVGTPLRQSDQ